MASQEEADTDENMRKFGGWDFENNLTLTILVCVVVKIMRLSKTTCPWMCCSMPTKKMDGIVHYSVNVSDTAPHITDKLSLNDKCFPDEGTDANPEPNYRLGLQYIGEIITDYEGTMEAVATITSGKEVAGYTASGFVFLQNGEPCIVYYSGVLSSANTICILGRYKVTVNYSANTDCFTVNNRDQ